MTDFLKIAKSIVVHFAHICAYGVETVKERVPAEPWVLTNPTFLRGKEHERRKLILVRTPAL